jgi:LacI family transcriptional regulator
MGRLAADYLTATPTQRLHLNSTELSIRLAVRGSSGAAPQRQGRGPGEQQ